MQLKASVIFIVFTLGLCTIGSSLQHDDILIAVGDQLGFLTNGSLYRTLTLDSFNASKLSALTYDATTRKLFFSDRRHRNGHIFSIKLDNEARHTVEDIVKKNSNETVESLAYDPVDQMLLWTDGFNRSIRRVQVDHDSVHVEESATVEIVHFLDKEDKPRGLVADPCTRNLYWTNRYMSHPTIERSFLNGSHREVLIKTDLLLPNALDLDVQEQMLYWADNHRKGYFSIERSFVNGTGKQEIYRGIGQFVVSLAVGTDYVYWSDYDHKHIWSLPKDGSSKNPIILRTFRNPVMGVTIFRHQPYDCRVVSVPIENSELPVQQEQLSKYDDADLCLGFCYNNGDCILVNSDLRCSCPVGFSGERCELESGKKDCETFVDSNQFQIIFLICIIITCVILLVIAVMLSVQFMKLTREKQPRVFRRRFLARPNKNENTLPVHDLEDCCNSFAMCERPCAQQQNVNATAKELGWENNGADCSVLLKCEF
ncbi:protein cueball-like [Daphnia carinata]|uniref:protein cueball-like n=1 Tax=Daphnia carinata TaxID=120202 RepID=UPI002579F5E5|nr:protein cueball-like [Daphnia carinata]